MEAQGVEPLIRLSYSGYYTSMTKPPSFDARLAHTSSGARRRLCHGADSRIRTGDLYPCRVSFCQLNYVRSSGDGCPPPEDHIPELLKSDGRASQACRQPHGVGFVFSTTRPQKQGARTAFANPGSFVWNRNLSITQDDYIVILPDCLLSFSRPFPDGRPGRR